MTTTVKLGDLLPDVAIVEIKELADRGECVARNIKPITNRYKDELLTKGVDADYLAYVIEHMVNTTAN